MLLLLLPMSYFLQGFSSPVMYKLFTKSMFKTGEIIKGHNNVCVWFICVLLKTTQPIYHLLREYIFECDVPFYEF